MLLFKHGDTLTLAVINRRLSKRDESKDVLEKVTLIKDIRFAAPHRAHVEILADLAFDELRQQHGFTNFIELHAAWRKTLDIQELNKRFYQQLQHWYFWALGHARFPADASKDADGRDSLSLIRLLTRLIFVWFIKEKGLVPENLFDARALPKLLRGFAPADSRAKGSVYYRAILQNLFFATLNQEPEQRGWRRKEQNFMAHSVYRHRDDFAASATALDLFKDIPFLNGGLFECLDKIDGPPEKPRYIRIDGFSDRPDSQPVVPDFLFFGPEQDADLSDFYEETKRKSRPARVRGLLAIFHDFKFTIEENTPLEEDVALDPELLGRVFENLLAAYNPETQVTARKQTGSFYTPREIVDYMTGQALFYALRQKVADLPDIDARLTSLLAHDDAPNLFNPGETARLIAAIDDLKVLDPACGSGAFPMGVLHRLVHALQKLDPGNVRWKQRQIDKATEIPDATVREHVTADIEQAFGANELGYGRKLYLVENCLYGVDIQPIAAQITKLRFFISLVVEQRTDPKAPNRGIRPLPNLETKIVAANTLIGIARPGQQMLRNLDIDTKEAELRHVRDEHFLARTPKKKAKCREDDARLRTEIAALLKDDGWDSATAKKLSAWDPYDQNAHADFFDNEWMFGLTEGFDVVIGNPPYGMVKDESLLAYFSENYVTCEGRVDIYEMFCEQATRLVRAQGGRTIFIIPSPILTNVYSQRLRRFLLDQGNIDEITNFGLRVFEDPTIHNCIIGFTKGPTTGHQTAVRVQVTDLVDLSRGFDYCVSQDELSSGPTQSFDIFVPPALRLFLRRLDTMCRPLSEVCFIRQCIKTGDDERYVANSAKKLPSPWKPSFRGRSIERYETRETDLYLKYGDWLARNWQNRSFYETPKLAIRETGARITATLDEDSRYFLSSLYAVYPKEPSGGAQLKSLLAILNSAFATWFVRLIAFGLTEGAFTKIRTNQLGRLPIPTMDNPKSVKLAKLVDQILAAKRVDAGANTSALEAEIDQHVYALYGLTPEEIKIVEGSAEKL
jgi:adenine-specific DNA-methyltransferase